MQKENSVMAAEREKCLIIVHSYHHNNTNSFLKFFGGINKGRPNSEDLRNAEEFALSLE